AAARPGLGLPPELADRRDHRRHGEPRRGGCRRGRARPRAGLRRLLSDVRRDRPHQLLDPAHLRPGGGGARRPALRPVREAGVNISSRGTPLTLPEKIGLGVLAALLLLAPLIFSNFFLSALLTQAIWLGMVAMSLIFLSSYGGMVSLAQVAIFG